MSNQHGCGSVIISTWWEGAEIEGDGEGKDEEQLFAWTELQRVGEIPSPLFSTKINAPKNWKESRKKMIKGQYHYYLLIATRCQTTIGPSSGHC